MHSACLSASTMAYGEKDPTPYLFRPLTRQQAPEGVNDYVQKIDADPLRFTSQLFPRTDKWPQPGQADIRTYELPTKNQAQSWAWNL